jgi:hypothetical protein
MARVLAPDFGTTKTSKPKHPYKFLNPKEHNLVPNNKIIDNKYVLATHNQEQGNFHYFSRFFFCKKKNTILRITNANIGNNIKRLGKI